MTEQACNRTEWKLEIGRQVDVVSDPVLIIHINSNKLDTSSNNSKSIPLNLKLSNIFALARFNFCKFYINVNSNKIIDNETNCSYNCEN